MLATATKTTTRGQHLHDLKQGDDRYLLIKSKGTE